MTILDEKVLEDGTKRVSVAIEGRSTPRGWVTLSKLAQPAGATQRNDGTARPSSAPPDAAVANPPAASKPALVRGGSLVKLTGLEKKYNGQMGRVVDMNGPIKGPDGSETNDLVAVLLAPKGAREGVWVAVPRANLELQ